jgi:hypothetical protein
MGMICALSDLLCLDSRQPGNYITTSFSGYAR